jgi:cell division protein ZapA
MTDASGSVVTVEILGQRYPIRSSLDTSYVTKLAAYVDQKMQAAGERIAGGDSLRVAVLAALNIADEYFRLRQNGALPDSEVLTATLELEQLLDEALADR